MEWRDKECRDFMTELHNHYILEAETGNASKNLL